MCELTSFASLSFSLFTRVFRTDDASKALFEEFLMKNAKKSGNLRKTAK